ncbi:unnamed protein product [Dracunculus medinensis]|uniref:Prefoldin subunit 1 n=1 Tax=Dracunculus medinensis TaxID=318479 RepID=A0A0N4ULB9_DRAME|nr:unnamed protein product [Dracunculus medinensis]
MSDDYSTQLKKAFQDLQLKMIETNKRLQHGEMQRKLQEQACFKHFKKERIAQLTKMQLSELESERPVFRSIGRMFVRESIKDEIARSDREIASAKEKIATIDRQKEYLENNLAEAEGNLREMVQARP